MATMQGVVLPGNSTVEFRQFPIPSPARGQVLLSVSEADAKRMGKTPTQVAQIAAASIRGVVWKQLVDTVY